MNQIIIKGELFRKLEVIQVGKNNTPKMQFVINTGGEYPQYIPINAFGDEKVEIIQALNVGMNLSVYINLKGNEWQDRFFLNADMWKVEVESDMQEPVSEQKEDNEVPF